ncbi:hypothetical protein [Conyzicola sp.]|uniref:hypothetical protein n=1 Tax=Conyzicola sp. TaxID=1969404 RepID=UPI003989B6AE
MSFIALGWSAIATIALAYFAFVVAPAIGDVMDLYMSSKRGGFDVRVITGVLADVSLWVAGALVALAMASIAVWRRSQKASYTLAVIVCFAVPLYLGVVLPNAWLTLVDPAQENGWLLAGAGASGLIGLTIGGLSFTFGPAIIDELRAGTLLRPRKPKHEAG